MKMWTVILAGLLLVSLSSALDDAGVYVNGTYSQEKFERRVWPRKTHLACADFAMTAKDWFRTNLREKVLLDFAGGKNDKNATFRLGTPTLHVVGIDNGVFYSFYYCKYLPTAFHNITARSSDAMITREMKMEYFAVKVNNTEQATIKKGRNYLTNLVKNRFKDIKPADLAIMAVEVASSGQVYLGLVQNYTP